MGCCAGGGAKDDKEEPLVGKKKGKPTGTDFKETQQDRSKYHDVDEEAADLPFNLAKEVNTEIDMMIKKSKFFKEYKREWRDALKRKKAKNHEPRLFRLYDKSLHPADEAAGKEENRKALRDRITAEVLPAAKEELIEGYTEDGLRLSDKQKEAKAEMQIKRLAQERMQDEIYGWAERMFKKDRQGKDADESDADDDGDYKSKEKAKAERRKAMLKQKQQEQEEWEEEQKGGSPKDKKKEEDSGGKESPKGPPASIQPPKRGGKKGGADPEFRKKCEDFYKHYAPEKVKGLEEQIEKREGNQEHLDSMWQAMVDKYGPWPPEKTGKQKTGGGAAPPSPRSGKKPGKGPDEKEKKK